MKKEVIFFNFLIFQFICFSSSKSLLKTKIIQTPPNLYIKKIKFYNKSNTNSFILTENTIAKYKSPSSYDNPFNFDYYSNDTSFFSIPVNFIKQIISTDYVMHILTFNGLVYLIVIDYK